ncbi:VIT and VWA domain-containing protein [Clostridium sp. JN-9]|uniref:VIT and vWA domain-containing protein n=1 Tax=Clostridium sp. JN-9 TaxID=2507159 RepID=UPI000FFE21A2|nr:VIT and VWA domain-containing protein [Clostridium sp. JN-9]QAT40085.1 VWA domain-containing protein [Clostridium sp. JN-9]
MLNYGIRDIKGLEDNIVLKDVKVNANICGEFGEITINQVYENLGNSFVDGTYIFPIPETAVISGLEVDFGGRTLKTLIDEKDKALKVYNNAKETGERTFTLDEIAPHLYQISIGKIIPGEKINIKLSYIDELKYNDKTFKLNIPAIREPRDIEGVKVKKVVNKALRRSINKSVNYNFKLNIIVESLCRLDFDSPSHYINVEREGDNVAKITLDEEFEYYDEDFILLLKEKEDEEASGMIYEYKENNEKKSIIYLRLVPKLDAIEDDKNEQYIFLIDISETMKGEKLEQAKDALQLCIRNLSQGDTFDIVAMGDTLKYFCEEGVAEFNSDTLRSASRWIDELTTESDADIFGAIKYSLENEGEGNTILIFTDDEIDEEEELLEYVRNNLNNNRIFCFGIDSSVNSYFLNKLAHESYGKAEFIFSGERIEPKVLRQFTRIENPEIDDIKINWGDLKVDETYPRTIDYIYDREPFSIFARADGEVQGEIIITGVVGDKPYLKKVDLDNFNTEDNANLIQKVWARKRIKSLEMNMISERGEIKESMRKKVVEISKKYNILSLETSFILIEEREEKVLGIGLKNIIPLKVNEKNLSNDIIENIKDADLNEPSFLYKTHKKSNNKYKDDTDYLDKKYPRDKILRIMAKNQFADGSFVDNEDLSTKDKVETTAMSIIAFTCGDEDITIYVNQLNKSIEFLLNCLSSNNDDYDSRLNNLVMLSLEISLDKEIIKLKNKNNVIDAVNNLYAELYPDAVENWMDKPISRNHIISLFNLSHDGKSIEEDIIINKENSSIYSLAKLGVLETL